MTTIEPALARAKMVIANNSYFALATHDKDGPWVAALAHTFVKPNYLCFYSHAKSRHANAIGGGAKVAGLIYDSQCTFEEVESIQFSGWADVPTDRQTVVALMTAINEKEGKPAPTELEVDMRIGDKDTLLFRVSVDDAYVLDQMVFQREGIDARERVDVIAMFNENR